MSNKNQTAVEFLLDKITLKKIDEGIYTYPIITVEEMEQFKEMQKQQIMDAYNEGLYNWDSEQTAQQYYTQTYGGQNHE